MHRTPNLKSLPILLLFRTLQVGLGQGCVHFYSCVGSVGSQTGTTVHTPHTYTDGMFSWQVCWCWLQEMTQRWRTRLSASYVSLHAFHFRARVAHVAPCHECAELYDPRPRSSQGSARGGAETVRTTKIFVVDSSRAAARGKQGLHVDVHVARARVISEVFQSVTGLDPPTHFWSYYGLEKTFDNCGRPLRTFQVGRLLECAFKMC